MQLINKEQVKDWLSVYFIMGSPNCRKDPKETLEEAIEGGATLFQFREKGANALTGEKKWMLAAELQDVCRRQAIPFLVNDDIELAVKLEADGVHIGQEDAALSDVRKRLPRRIIGVSVHTMEEAIKAIDEGADYLGIGPVFPTATKADAQPVQGTKLIEEIRSAGLSIPIVGIGGIQAENAAQVVSSGADGVSVITAISQAASPREAAAQLKKAILEN